MSRHCFQTLEYEPAFLSLGEEYWDEVQAATFPQHILRFRNDALLPLMGLNPAKVTDADFIAAFGQFQGREPFLAMRYHGYQFGEYNARLGDGRGFLYGQFRGVDGQLYDLGTKGSGITPYSRGGDGRLTLKGGVREVLASELLHRLGVSTFRSLSLVETGESLWRGDEPSPTRSSILVRLGRSHIRFGTFERLHYLRRPDLIRRLLDHVIYYYYPHLLEIPDPKERDCTFYRELVARTADLAAQWLVAGFCHGVLNTDNMAITGESFDYGPYVFLEHYDLGFTAAYFDYYGRYAYGNQPAICAWNLEKLQIPLSSVMPLEEMQAALKTFGDRCQTTYLKLMLKRLGWADLPLEIGHPLVAETQAFLSRSTISYPQFFVSLRQEFSPEWAVDPSHIFRNSSTLTPADQKLLEVWKRTYFELLQQASPRQRAAIPQTLQAANPLVILTRSQIEHIWQAIDQADDWSRFTTALELMQA
ncbi:MULTISPECIES: protein adenylyltransferase SelO family protein [unclassified Thermosynechococcus]|uniref:protein adenylyltransferase SelO n=1 Tax=unclassified Thermosynechococcus TaxID=2622553 RepID=UPI002877E0A6|nr:MULTISPECIES: YdiU family protein [unclassified Thermosynechococcus]WNC52882.1 YdiU family protein [Thermosynechococcus sp. TG215]WNC57973.1 YdiU family protein [Thermosynechococcus sp. TG218]